MNLVVISKREKGAFHEEYCPYVKRIQKRFRRRVPEDEAVKRGYCECKFCRSVRGIVYKYRTSTDLDVSYDKIDDAMCVRTPVGFWKLIWRENYQVWHLFHMNKKGWKHFDSNLQSEKLMRGSFHRQEDFIPTASAEKAVKYILSHDNSYQIAEEQGVEKMPQRTPKQKLHYRQQKNRKKKESIRNVFKIFDELERKNKNGSKY